MRFHTAPRSPVISRIQKKKDKKSTWFRETDAILPTGLRRDLLRERGGCKPAPLLFFFPRVSGGCCRAISPAGSRVSHRVRRRRPRRKAPRTRSSIAELLPRECLLDPEDRPRSRGSGSIARSRFD